MRDKHKRYMCYPSVVCVGQETEITIFPKDISRRFVENHEYKIGVFGLRDAFADYHHEPEYTIESKVSDGCVKFTYTFEKMGFTPDMIEYAGSLASSSTVPYAYMTTILNSWKSKGITTIAAAKNEKSTTIDNKEKLISHNYTKEELNSSYISIDNLDF